MKLIALIIFMLMCFVSLGESGGWYDWGEEDYCYEIRGVVSNKGGTVETIFLEDAEVMKFKKVMDGNGSKLLVRDSNIKVKIKIYR